MKKNQSNSDSKIDGTLWALAWQLPLITGFMVFIGIKIDKFLSFSIPIITILFAFIGFFYSIFKLYRYISNK